MADLRISDLVTASQLKNDDYYEISQSESGTRVSYKATLLAIAVQIATMVDFTSDLNTTSKKITGAINELKNLISLIPQFSIEVVQVLPTEDISDTTIYLVPAEDPEVGNYYEEYIHVNNTWELVGSTAVDLSAYYTKLEVDAKFSALATVATSGNYNDLTNKPDLTALMDVNETTFTNPYVKKIVPTGKYTEKLKKIIGASVVWNQMVTNPTQVKSYTANSANTWFIETNISYTANHYYLILVTQKNTFSSITRNTFILSDGTDHYSSELSHKGNGVWGAIIQAVNSTNSGNIKHWAQGGDVDNEFTNYQCIDLTAMFGSTIADYVYTLETQTAGSGIAWLKSYGFFTEPYYGYSANTMQSVSLAAKVNKDSGDTTISTVALDHTTLRGLFKLDANNNLYADGDEYLPNGDNPKKYAEVDLGDLTYNYSGNNLFTAPLPTAEIPTNDLLCSNYITLPYSTTSAKMTDKTIKTYGASGDKIIYIKDSLYSDPQTFKTAMSGVYLVYELATPTTATLTPYEKLQPIEQGGTEEFIDYGVQSSTRDVAIPAGNETAYGDNELMGKVVNYIND